MEAIEFVLVVMACVIVSSVIGKVTRRLALPLVQIAVGVVVALLVPAVGNVQISSESFLLLFIAPLLFNEARESKRAQLFINKGAILSLAVGLVVVSVVAVGGALWAMVPFLPLAATFACAAALAPTDAAAVGAMGSTVDLRGRQETLLSGESLINDASGVVAFQFAIAAALTGEFSAAAAGQEFLVLFVGGLAVGLAAGFVIWGAMAALRHFGYEDTTLHVLFEVTAPFAVYLLAEWAHVSGILAVVAAGIVMTNRAPRLVSADAARRQMVSNNFWKIIVFTINGIVFTLLGMELPRAFDPAITAYFPVPALLAVVVAATLLIYACRLVWIWVMELVHRDRVTGERGVRRPKEAFHDALVMTLAGAKGAVTLSIIFTIPLTLADGSPFPGRSLILLITAAVILCTLLCANFILPLLAPKELASDDEAVQRATIQVLERTLAQLRAGVAENAASEYTPALRLTAMRYETRLNGERLKLAQCGPLVEELSNKVLELQQKRADELQMGEKAGLTAAQAAPYFIALRGIRQSVGYQGSAAQVGARFRTVRDTARLVLARLRNDAVDDDEYERVYYDTCLFAIELEHTALTYLRDVEELGDGRQAAARVLIDSHEAALSSLWGRINYGQDFVQGGGTVDVRVHTRLPDGMRPNFLEQFAKARRYADESDENALIVELDIIRHMSLDGEITDAVARELRSRVYAMQAALESQRG